MEQSGPETVIEEGLEETATESPEIQQGSPDEPVPFDNSDTPMPTEVMSEEFFSAAVSESALNVIEVAERELRSLLEAIVYITDEPLSAQQIATAIDLAEAPALAIPAKLSAVIGAMTGWFKLRSPAKAA